MSDLKSILQPALLASLLDLLLRFRVDLNAFSEEHGVHASLEVCSIGVQQQVGQLWRGNKGVKIAVCQMTLDSDDNVSSKDSESDDDLEVWYFSAKHHHISKSLSPDFRRQQPHEQHIKIHDMMMHSTHKRGYEQLCVTESHSEKRLKKHMTIYKINVTKKENKAGDGVIVSCSDTGVNSLTSHTCGSRAASGRLWTAMHIQQRQTTINWFKINRNDMNEL